MANTYKLYDPKYTPAAFGFHGNGVICWLNSLLQGLLSCSVLNKTLLENKHMFYDNQFALDYIAIVEGAVNGNLQVPSSANIKLLDSLLAEMKKRGLVSKFKSNGQDFGVGQNCADEGLVIIIDLFDKPDRPFIGKLFKNRHILTVKCPQCDEVTNDPPKDESFQIELFTNLKLVQEKDFRDYILAHRSLVDEWKCEKCNNIHKKIFRVEQICMLREILIIVFNQSNSTEHRWFPQHLQFSSHSPDLTLTYELVAQIEHSGNQFGGHYWARCLRKLSNGELAWVSISDAAVSPSEYAPTPNTFVVIYNLKDAK